ncbi:hypothetical protein BD770DRAFT_415760 [Pilaira anomala]|nr:hypothetical protein BD770DRAFT_415760 [Pilaira anomala]
MVIIKPVMVLIPILAQVVQPYCIHNMVNSGFNVVHEFGPASEESKFSLFMEPGDSGCCHHYNANCSHDAREDEEAIFYFQFADWLAFVGKKYKLSCTTGGDLTINGVNGPFGVCRNAKGFAETVEFSLVD